MISTLHAALPRSASLKRASRAVARSLPAVAVVLIAAGAVAACGGNRIERFAGTKPPLSLESFFAGSTQGAGVLQNRFGRLINHFSIEAEGRWDPATRTLDLVEIYRFDDGRTDRLEWRIVALGNRLYRGTEKHIEGEASGEQAGNAFHWTYTRRVPMQDGEQSLAFDDWFWLTENGSLISRADVRRFGITVATLSAFYHKP